MNGSYPSRAGGFNQGLLAGAQLGMQFFQLKRQGDAIKREKDVGALNAQFKMLEFQLPYLSEEQINKRVKNLSKDFDKVYKTKFGIENIEFGGRGKEVFKELQKIEKDILSRKITNEIQVNAAVAKARLKFPHNKAYIDKRGKDLIGGFQSLVDTKRRAEDTILKMSDKYKAIGQTPEDVPQGMGLLPPGKMRAGETPTQGARATGLEPSGLLNMGGYQWQPKPELSFEKKEQIKAKYKTPTKPTGANKETIIQNYINKFKTPPGAMGAIKVHKAPERRARLKGLFQALEIEKKNPNTKLGESDRWRIIQTVMTDLGIDREIQQGIGAAMMADATADQLIEWIRRYEQRTKK